MLKKIIAAASFAALFSCTVPKAHYITQAQLRDTTYVAGTFDTLAAYRKAPGAPKTVYVKGYFKKDSTYVAPHNRSAPGS
jgi:hypothetical protein